VIEQAFNTMLEFVGHELNLPILMGGEV
jgi:hypothetical protein